MSELYFINKYHMRHAKVDDEVRIVDEDDEHYDCQGCIIGFAKQTKYVIVRFFKEVEDDNGDMNEEEFIEHYSPCQLELYTDIKLIERNLPAWF